jgi:hypothetical protein
MKNEQRRTIKTMKNEHRLAVVSHHYELYYIVVLFIVIYFHHYKAWARYFSFC